MGTPGGKKGKYSSTKKKEKRKEKRRKEKKEKKKKGKRHKILLISFLCLEKVVSIQSPETT